VTVGRRGLPSGVLVAAALTAIGATAAAAPAVRVRPFIDLWSVGRVEIRCAADGRAGASVVIAGATARVEIQSDGRRAASQTLQPGERLNAPLGHDRAQVITLVQSTEPQTLRVVIELDYAQKPRGLPCGTLAHSRVRTSTTSHFMG
jgi:hypothetical protein